MLLDENMIKEYTCLSQSLDVAQNLQSHAIGSSRTAYHLLITNKPSNTQVHTRKQ